MKRAALMARVSSDEQAKGYSLDVQSEALEKYCQRNDIEIVYTFREDHSAKNFNRPAFKEFMTFAKKNRGKVDFLLFTSWDRFSRNIQEAYKVIDSLRSLGIVPQAVEQPIDLSIPENKAILAMFLVIPEIDNDRRSIKTRGGIRAALKAGRWCCSAPYGYSNSRDANNKPIIVANEHAPNIRWAFDEILKGVSQRDVQRELNRRGCMIQKTRMSKMLRNPVYIGKIEVPEYGQEPYQLVEGVHGAIVSEAVFYKVQELLSRRKPKRLISKKTKDELLPLRGILKCSKCGSRLTGSHSRGKRGGLYAYYHCNHCGQERYRAEIINQTIEDILGATKLKTDVQTLADGIARDLLNGDKNERSVRASKLKNVITQQEERIIRLQDNLADGVISSDDYLNMKNRYSVKVQHARTELAQLESSDSEKEMLISSAILSLNQLGHRYSTAEAEVKIRLLGSIFPEMIEFDGNKCRTPRINEAAALCFNIDAAFRGKRKGTIHPKLELSPLVARRGFEPLLPG
jgi:site-specific DNA recombinase